MISIAIDGVSGSGKSTLAEMIAKKLKFKYLNTGSIYRAIAYAFDKSGLELNKDNVVSFFKGKKIEIVFKCGIQHMIVDGEDVTKFLRQEKISTLSSQVSAFPEIREMVRGIQREFAENNNVVMEGRDIGSVILPNATVKIYLTADVEVRAKRRFLEMQDVTYEEVLEDLKQRDYRDMNRAVAPLIICQDAFILDNTNLDINGTFEVAMKMIKDKIKVA